jgi:Tfp pilus assembly protein PilX
MNRTDCLGRTGPQRGVALAMALILLLVLTLIGVVGMRTSILELAMSRNEQERMSAFERAQSLVDAILSVSENFAVAGIVGQSVCLKFGAASCTIDVPDDVMAGVHGPRSTGTTTYDGCGAPPPATNSSLTLFDAANFTIEATYDGSDAKQGRATIGQGVMILVAKGKQQGCIY